MPEKGEELYKILKADPNYEGVGSDYNKFKTFFSDEKNYTNLYNTLKADPNYEGIGKDADAFSEYFGLKKKDLQGFSQELPKPAMPSGEKFTQGIGLGVKPISSTASPSASKQPKSTIPSESTDGKSKQAPFQNVDISRPELEVAKYDKVQERNRIQNYSQGLQKVQIDAEKKIRQRDELLAGIEQMQVDLEASKGNPEQYNALIPQYNELVNNAKSLTNEISSDFNKMDIFEKGIGVTELKRQINEDTIGNRALEGVNNAKRIVLEAFPATAQVASYLTMRSRGIDPQTAEKVSTDIVENGFPNLKRWSRELAEENEDLRSVFDQTTAWDVLTEKDKSLLEKDWAKIGELSAKELVQTLPTTLAIMGTYINPIAGATTTIMGTAGMELEEMQGSNMTPDAKIANALTKGGLEYATEKVFGSIPMLKRAIGMKSKAGQEAYQNIVLETWNKFASKMGFAADVIEEVGSEMLNTIGGNYTDYLSGKTTEADLYKGLGETFTTSLTMASTLSGAGRAVKYGNKKINELRNATKKLKEISESQETTPEVLQVIQDKIVENNEKIAAEAKVEKKVFDSMDDKTWSETTTLIQETQSLEQQLENNEVPEDVIPLVEDKIKEGYEKIDELTKKAKENAIQEPSTGEVLQRQQEEAGITGSERTGVEQSQQGEKVAQEGQAQEEVKYNIDEARQQFIKDNEIEAFQEKFGYQPYNPFESLPDGVYETILRVEDNTPTSLTAIEEASNWLYSQYKMLEAKKVADTRDMTIPQIDEVLSELEGAITELENFKNKLYEESGQAKGGQDTTPVQAVGGQTGQGVRVGEEIAAPTQEVVKSENKASEPSKSDKNYQDAQNINSIVSKENPDASVLIQPKGDNLALTAIYVGKGKRRGGIGSKALETIKREAKKLGKKVVLDATNELDQETDLKRLGNFYERNGFKKVGENTYEYDPKNEASSGDTSARTDNTGAEVGDTASATDKRQSGKKPIKESQQIADELLNVLGLSTEETDVKFSKVPTEKINWSESKIGRGDRAITERNDNVKNAAEDLYQGRIGLDEYNEIVEKNSPIKPITEFIEPAAEKDIRVAVGDKSEGKINLDFPKGKKVGLRLDIPAYINKNIWAITVHEDGKTGSPLSYNNVARIKNVEFTSDPKVALDIARQKELPSGGKMGKATIARMMGEWIPISGNTSELKGESAMKMIDEIKNNPDWSQVGMNPFRHSYFYDRETGLPVIAAEEVIQIGGLVYAKNVETTSKNDERFIVKDKNGNPIIGKEGEAVRFSKGKKSDKVLLSETEKEQQVIDQMNKMNLVNEGIDLVAPSTTEEEIDVDELNSRLENPLKTIKWADYEGIPFTFTISDQLRTGDAVNPNTGQTITDLKGGIGFNGTKGNENNAWANTTKEEADAMLQRAKDVYANNKPLFDKLWKEGKLPDGHIPMAVVKMAETSILSNEAVFRVGIQNIETLPKANRKKAVLELAKSMQAKINTESASLKRGVDKNGKPYTENTIKLKKKAINQYQKILDSINKNKYEDIVDVLKDKDNFSLPEKSLIANEVFYGSPTPIGGKEIDISRSRPSTPVSKALIGNKNPSLINLGKITDLLTEPSMKNVPNMHVVSIVGVDVKANEANKINHPNYPYGVKGVSLGVLKNPVHMKDVFGEAYGSALGQVVKNEANNASVSVKNVLAQGIPVQSGLPNRVFKSAIAKGELDAVDKLAGFLRQAFPSTTFFTSEEAWEAAMEDPSIKKKLKDGDVVYAFTTDGNVFINPSLKTTKATLHETGHIWMGFVKENNPALHAKGLELVTGTKEHQKAIKEYGDTELAREEALMELMSSKGDTIVNAAQKAKFKEWLLSVYKYIADNFTSLLGLSPKQIENLTLDKFLEGMLADVLSGKELTTKKIKGEVKFSREAQNNRIKEFVESQRKSGKSDSNIKAALELIADRLGLSTSDINSLMSAEAKKFPKNVLAISEETGLSPQQIENTYKKYDGSKDVEEITIEDYNNARATGDKAKLEVSAKAFDALLQQENAKTSTSPTAKKNAEKSLKEADEKALKEASKIMEHINEIRAKLQESGIIKSTSCKWGK